MESKYAIYKHPSDYKPVSVSLLLILFVKCKYLSCFYKPLIASAIGVLYTDIWGDKGSWEQGAHAGSLQG